LGGSVYGFDLDFGTVCIDLVFSGCTFGISGWMGSYEIRTLNGLEQALEELSVTKEQALDILGMDAAMLNCVRACLRR
jgi:hypothetical protein